MSTGNRGRRGHGGWTLIELVIVMAIITVLAALATVGARNAVTLSREATLKEDLFRMRDAIDQYYADKGKYPESLEQLMEQGYLRAIPADPMTGAPDWTVIPAEPDPDDPDMTGIYDVKSASAAVSIGGTPYSEW
jgi:general secretion pathway protein G